MENTGRYELPLLIPSQAQKHVTHNEALTLVDGLLHPAIKTFGETSPPVSAATNDLFYVGVGASGDWFGQSGKLALLTTEGWRFAPVRFDSHRDVAAQLQLSASERCNQHSV